MKRILATLSALLIATAAVSAEVSLGCKGGAAFGLGSQMLGEQKYDWAMPIIFLLSLS